MFISSSLETGFFSDDGHKLSSGRDPRDVPNLLDIGIASGGRANERLYFCIVEQAGIYPFRLMWYEGGGDATLEWYSLDPPSPSGQRIQINDLSNAKAIKAYRTATIPPPAPQITSIAAAGGNITIQWSGGGTLQSAPTVTGPWTNTSGTSGTFTEAIAGGAKFYRVFR